MEENKGLASISPEEPVQSRPQNASAALVSALIPGFGQFMLGERITGSIFLALDVIWVMFFFAPFRLPSFYSGWLSIVLLAVVLPISASCQALRTRSEGRLPGHWLWLLGILPLALIAVIFFHTILLRAGGFRAFRVPSGSVERTIQNGDVLMADMHFYRHHSPKNGEIILMT